MRLGNVGQEQSADREGKVEGLGGSEVPGKEGVEIPRDDRIDDDVDDEHDEDVKHRMTVVDADRLRYIAPLKPDAWKEQGTSYRPPSRQFGST